MHGVAPEVLTEIERVKTITADLIAEGVNTSEAERAAVEIWALERHA